MSYEIRPGRAFEADYGWERWAVVRQGVDYPLVWAFTRRGARRTARGWLRADDRAESRRERVV